MVLEIRQSCSTDFQWGWMSRYDSGKAIVTFTASRGPFISVSKKITKAIKKLEGIDIVIKTVEDAKKAMLLILRKTEISHTKDYEGLKDIAITQVVEHATSAVEYQTYYEVEFILTDDRFIEMEIALIRELQTMFEKI